MNSPSIRCLIVEDDFRAREVSTLLLQNNFPNIELVGTATTLSEAHELITLKQPDLLILDFNLPDGTAFELLKKLNNNTFEIVFTTAHSKYAVEAFKFSALDYLLKPYAPKDFIQAITKATEQVGQSNHKLLLEAFYHNYKSSGHRDKKLVLKSADSIEVVGVKGIIQAMADNNYTRFLLADGRLLTVSKALKSFDERLSICGFIRVHQSHLINTDYILSFDKREMQLLLTTDIKVPVAQSRKSMLMAYFDQLDI